jgi:hypothetical protein
MFGLGAGFTMRDLAVNVVATANNLFPTGPHAGVFEANFRSLGILPAPVTAATPPGTASPASPSTKQ